jgi:RNA polymerase sigma factor (sigma-70 family)
VEASALQAPAGLARTRLSIGASLLRLRSDEQLVALFRDGNEEAFRVIHDRYRTRLFAYTRQMLPGSRPDAEDALQDIFVRAYSGLRANDRELSLRAWLYRVAHNRCVDELRKPAPPTPEVLGRLRPPAHDPMVEAEQRESLRRLIADVRRLPDQQRSALLMRELGGMAYADLAAALDVSVPAVKSLLVRARVSLAQALEARDTACAEIQEELIVAHDRGVRPSGLARRHMHDCSGCREFRGKMRGVSRQFAALAPTIGPLGVLANIFGIGGGAGGGAAAAGTGAAAAGGAAGTTGAVASIGGLAGVSHVATILAAAVVTAGGAVELQHTLTNNPHHARHHAHVVMRSDNEAAATAPSTPVAASGSSAPAVAPVTVTPPTHKPAVSAKQPGSSSSSSTSATGKTATSTPTTTGAGASGIPAGSEITPLTTTDPSTTVTGSTGTTISSTPGDSATTGITDPNATGTPTSASGTGSTTETAPATTSTSTATGDVISLGVTTSSTPPATTGGTTSTSSAPATSSPVASYPSGDTSWSGGRMHH